MLQYIHAERKDKCDPTIKEMHEAAVQHNQVAQDDSQVFEPMRYQSDSELDIYLTTEMNNSEDELIALSDEDLRQDMAKFIPQKAHKYKATAKGWSTRFSKNVRERHRVTEGDTIDIFHLEARVWKPYTLLQICSAKSYVICLQSDPVKILRLT